METKNVVIALLCTSIVILSIAAPISAVELENSGISGEIDGTGEVTGSVSLETSIANGGTANVEASIEVSVDLVGPGSAKASQEGPVTDTVETDLGTIVADVSEDSNVNVAVEVVGDGSASADAYVGTTASLGESEVDIESKISSNVDVDTNGGSASATASATGTTTGDGISYATGGASDDATSYAEVSGNTEANAVVSGTAEAESYAAVGSTDYARHNVVTETSYIEAGSYAWSDGGQASADSSANGEAYQYGQAENCASSETYAEGIVSSAVQTEGDAYAGSYSEIWSYGSARNDTDGAYVHVDSDIYAWTEAGSDPDGKASAVFSADGDTGAAGSACTCVYLDTSAIGKVSSAVATQGDADADSYSEICSYGWARKDTNYAYVSEESEIWTYSYAYSYPDGKASADSASIGYTGAEGSACTCVYLDTSAIGKVSSAVATQGDADADSYSEILSDGYARNDIDKAYVEEYSEIWTYSYAYSYPDGKASADSASIGYTGAEGSACTCVYLDTYAIGKVSSAVATQGDADAYSESEIWSYGRARNDTDKAYVDEESEIWTYSYAYSYPDGKASADSASIGYTGAEGSACTCVYLDTSAIGKVSSAVATQGDADADSESEIWSYGYARNDTDEAYVDEESEIWTYSYAYSDPDGKASADSASIGYTGAEGSACTCVYLDTSAIGKVSSAVQTEGEAYADSESEIWSDGYAYKDTDKAYVDEESEIWTYSYAYSYPDGKASADSASIGYTGAEGSACTCVYLDTSAIGIGSSAVQTEGDAYADSESEIWSDGYARNDTDEAYVEEYSEIWSYSYADSYPDGKASADSSAKGYTGATGSACDCLDSWTNAKGAVQVKTETDGNAWITADARLTSDGWILIGDQMRANSVINTSATAMHNSNSAGTATADGSTEAGASDSCTGEWVETGILDGDGDTIVNPFNLMYTNAYAGFAYANAIPDGFEAIDLNFDINTLGPIENKAYSSIEAIAMIPAP